jgi:hypothetical protein
MKMRVVVLTLAIVLIGVTVFAADGDLIVNGKLGVGTGVSGALWFLGGTNGPTQGRAGYLYADWGNFYIGNGWGRVMVELAGDEGHALSVQEPSPPWECAGWWFDGSSGGGTGMWFHTAAGAAGMNFKLAEAAGNSNFRVLNENSSPLLVINSTGNTSIGTADSSGYKFYVNGQAYSTGGWTASDVRLKKNIEPISNGVSLIRRLQGVRFDWKRDEFKDKNLDDGKQIGLIAQDVEKVLPELVKTDKEGYKAVSYDKLTAVLVEAIKDQQKQISQLRAEIDKLKGK